MSEVGQNCISTVFISYVFLSSCKLSSMKNIICKLILLTLLVSTNWVSSYYSTWYISWWRLVYKGPSFYVSSNSSYVFTSNNYIVSDVNYFLTLLPSCISIQYTEVKTTHVHNYKMNIFINVTFRNIMYMIKRNFCWKPIKWAQLKEGETRLTLLQDS